MRRTPEVSAPFFRDIEAVYVLDERFGGGSRRLDVGGDFRLLEVRLGIARTSISDSNGRHGDDSAGVGGPTRAEHNCGGAPLEDQIWVTYSLAAP